jgi:hypothetical protein
MFVNAPITVDEANPSDIVRSMSSAVVKPALKVATSTSARA